MQDIPFPEIDVLWTVDAAVVGRGSEIRDNLCRCGFWLAAMERDGDAFRLRLGRVGVNDTVADLLFLLRKALKPFGKRSGIAIADTAFSAWKAEIKKLKPLGGSGTRSYVVREGDVVTKVYHPAAREYLERELKMRDVLHHMPEVCPVLKNGGNWFSMPYIEQGWRWKDRGWNLYPVGKAKKVLNFIRALNTAGYAMVDWSPGCFLFDRDGNLKVVDFEYTHETSPADDLNARGHQVFIPGCPAVSYGHDWRTLTGLPLQGVMEWSPVYQTVYRLWFCLTHRWPRLVNNAFKFVFRMIKNAVKRAVFIRRRNGTTVWAL